MRGIKTHQHHTLPPLPDTAPRLYFPSHKHSEEEYCCPCPSHLLCVGYDIRKLNNQSFIYCGYTLFLVAGQTQGTAYTVKRWWSQKYAR